jgi:hypothetical protein
VKPPTRLPVPKSATGTVLGMPPRPGEPRSEPRPPVDAPVEALARSESKAPSERPRITSAKSTVRGQPIEKPAQQNDSERPRIESATKTVMGVGTASPKSKRKWVIDDDESTEALRVAAQRRTRTYYVIGGAIAVALVLVILVAIAK